MTRAALALLAAMALARGAQAADPWRDYQIIEWQPRTAAAYAALKTLGVTAGAVIANRNNPTGAPATPLAPLRANGLRWYIENIATDFYAPYHRWRRGMPVNAAFLAAQARYRADPADAAALWRQPSLSDPVWLQAIRTRLQTTVRSQRQFAPLFYSLGDETGIADLSAFWDFDLSPDSLAAMRPWLRAQYPSLAALNAEWDTRFADWEDVVPETTRAAMRRPGDNFAAWSDFKAWMDAAFADALRAGADAVHAADPAALAAIEGAQLPGWGGYDYTRLAHAVDAMEIYDGGENMPIVRALNPDMRLLTTSFGAANDGDLRAIWRQWLRGGRGLILWDAGQDIVRDDGTIGPRGRAYAPIFAELRGGLGALLIRATPAPDPVAVLYSPASFRVQWMLDNRPRGDAWMSEGAEDSLRDDAWRTALRGYVSSLRQLGLQPRFVSPAMLARGDVAARALVLPDTLALSPEESAAVRAFAARGGTVIADRVPGAFDGHGRRMARPSLANAGVAIAAPDDAATLRLLLDRAGVRPQVAVAAPDGDVETHVYTLANTVIVAVQRIGDGIGDETVTLTLPAAAYAFDLRQRRALGRVARISVGLDPVAPALYALAPTNTEAALLPTGSPRSTP